MNYTHFLEELKRFRDTEITTTPRLSKGVMGCSLSGPRKITKTGSTGPSLLVYVYAKNERGHGKGSSIAKDFIKSGSATKPG